MSDLTFFYSEGRILDNQLGLIEGHMKFLPKDTCLIVYCSENNKHQFAGVSKYVIGLRHRTDFNYLLSTTEFWKTMPTEKVLVGQSDSALLRTGIEEFYKYDYVGAPWKFQDHGGNGGLSLRSKSVMEYITSKFAFPGGNEDVWFCNIMHERQMNLAPRFENEKFSVETIFSLGTLGYHNIDTYLTQKECKLIRNQYDLGANKKR
jgi:hypothetical protein